VSDKLVRRASLLVAAVVFGAFGGGATAAEEKMLQLEVKIPLGDIRGRIDHMAIDPIRQRLFVAELGNDSVGVIDLRLGKVLRNLAGLKEPQGVGYVTSTDTLYVANAGDGSVHLYQGPDYVPAGQIELGDDADNIRVDQVADRIFIGYGSGALAIIDPQVPRKIADIPLRAHPEAFQLDAAGSRIFVNLPDARAIAVVDRATAKQIANWPMSGADANFPMALDEATQQVLTVFRKPAMLGIFAMADGRPLASLEVCGDADDIFVDAKRRRIYISCGDGNIDVIDAANSPYRRMARIPTVSGARTSFFVAEMDRLLLAVRARSGEVAAIWVYRPLP
jgi:DNA-binding beta-propeller fold protein YncE